MSVQPDIAAEPITRAAIAEPLAERLEQIRFKVDLVLSGLSQSLLEARLVITREFEFEPRAEELQAIVRLAADRASASLCDELPLRLLVARILLGQMQREFWDGSRLDAALLGEWTEQVPELLEHVRLLEREFASVAEGKRQVGLPERDFLRQVARAVPLDREPIRAAGVLGPRLVQMTALRQVAELQAVARGLGESDARLFLRVGDAARLQGAEGSRCCLDALAMRSLLEDELHEWRAGDGPDTERDAFLAERLARFESLEAAYHHVSDRLQARQDAALTANLDAFAVEVRRIRGDLFGSYRNLATIVRHGGPAPQDEEQARAAAQRREAMLRQVVEAEAAEAGQRTVSTDEVILDAMKRMREPDAAPEPRAGADTIHRERRRTLWLGTVAGVLAVAAAAVHLMLPAPLPEVLPIATVDFNPNTRIEKVESLGALLYSQVSDWQELSTDRRLQKINEIGGVASKRGFEAVYVVDGHGEEVATWTRNGGPQIK